MNENDKVIEILLEEFRLLRQDIKDDRMLIYTELESVKKDINTLKTRFMIIAMTMGVAGSKLSSFLPFLK